MRDSAARIVSFVWKKVNYCFCDLFMGVFDGSFGICKVNSVNYLLKKDSEMSVPCFWI